MKCAYCGTDEQKGKTCEKCGASIPEASQDIWKNEPFFYNGYIVYTLIDRMADTIEVQFWLGRELQERISASRELLQSRVLPCEDGMSFFWELFLLARGEKEVIEWQEKNKKYPALFQITRSENPEKQRWSSLTMHDLAKELRT
jgi:hypothetical protein